MTDVDCMTCLVRQTQDGPHDNVWKDDAEITHAIVLWLSGHVHVTLCTLVEDSGHWLVVNETTRVPR